MVLAYAVSVVHVHHILILDRHPQYAAQSLLKLILCWESHKHRIQTGNVNTRTKLAVSRKNYVFSGQIVYYLLVRFRVIAVHNEFAALVNVQLIMQSLIVRLVSAEHHASKAVKLIIKLL